jgi:hypothetical protein
MIAGKDPVEVQYLFDLITDKFTAMGIRMNAYKTESMRTDGGESSQPMTQESCHHRITRQGKSWKETSKEQIPCSLCGSFFSRSNITQHQQTRKCIQGRKHYLLQNTNHIQQHIHDLHN